MMGFTHIVVSGTATSLLLGTAHPGILLTGAIAGLLPDIDISTSTAGRIFPWIANYLERRFPHRSCTHSLLASIVVAVVSYSIVYLFNNNFLEGVHALNIGYLFGWFLDCFSKTGVEMFWPSKERYVCPANQKFRLRTGSPAEYLLLTFLAFIAILVFNINANGGVLNQFNRLVGAPSGVVEIYNKSAATHLVIAHIKGVRSADRLPIEGDFTILEARGSDFIVQSKDGKIYKTGLDSSAQIIPEHMTADVDRLAITNLGSVNLDYENLGKALEKFQNKNAMIFISGSVTIDDSEGVRYNRDLLQYPFAQVSNSSLTLEVAPLSMVLSYFSDQYSTGQLQIKTIYVSEVGRK